MERNGIEGGRLSEEELIDEASAESFPASDAPGYRSLSIGGRAADFGEPNHLTRETPSSEESAR